MTNEEKAGIYHSLLMKHDKLDGKVADVKAEAAGMTLNEDQKNRLRLLEKEKLELVAQAQLLFPDFQV